MKLLTLLTTLTLSLTHVSQAQAQSTILHLGKVPNQLENITVDYDGFTKNDLGYVRYACPPDNQIPSVRTLAHQYYKIVAGEFPTNQPPLEFFTSANVIKTMCEQKVPGTINNAS